MTITTTYEAISAEELANIIATNGKFVDEVMGASAPPSGKLLERSLFPEGPVVCGFLFVAHYLFCLICL